jgi:glycosyltransferase involved in cell wall biosynthesis
VNILCVEQFSKLGGGQRSLLDLLPGFLARGWQVAVGVPGPGPLAEAAAGLGCTIANLHCGNYSQERKPIQEMAKYAIECLRLNRAVGNILRKQQIDLVYVNGPRFLPPVAWAAKRKSIPLVFHCHNRLLQSSAIAITGAALQISHAHVIACSEYSVKPLRRYISPSQIQIIYNGVREPALGERRIETPIRRIGVIGRIEKEKGQMEFVEAARTIAAQVSGCSFVIGGAPLFAASDYFDRVAAASAGLPFEFTGWQDDISALLSRLDLVVVPSASIDSLPRIIFESFAAGVPVVAFPVGGIPEIIRDGVTGFLTTEATASSLADRILAVMNESVGAIERVTGRARERWELDHTLDTYQNRVAQILAKCRHRAGRLPEQPAALELSKGGER